MQLVGRQLLYNGKCLGVSAKPVERKRIGYSAIDLVSGAIVRLPGELMRLFRILAKIEAEAGEVRGDRRLVGRALVKALKNIVQLPGFILRPIKPTKRLESFTAHQRIFRNPPPEFFGLLIEFPFRGKPGEGKFIFRALFC